MIIVSCCFEEKDHREGRRDIIFKIPSYCIATGIFKNNYTNYNFQRAEKLLKLCHVSHQKPEKFVNVNFSGLVTSPLSSQCIIKFEIQPGHRNQYN